MFLKEALSMYLNRRVDRIDFGYEIGLNSDETRIIFWSIDYKPEPSLIELQSLYDASILSYAKENQKKMIGEDFVISINDTSHPVVTSVVSSNTGKFIEANATRDDLDNLDKLQKKMIGRNITEVLFKDYDNVFHTINQDELNIIILDIIDAGHTKYYKKWEQEAKIDAATSIVEVQAIKYNS
jgi:hypothetical protein